MNAVVKPRPAYAEGWSDEQLEAFRARKREASRRRNRRVAVMTPAQVERQRELGRERERRRLADARIRQAVNQRRNARRAADPQRVVEQAQRLARQVSQLSVPGAYARWSEPKTARELQSALYWSMRTTRVERVVSFDNLKRPSSLRVDESIDTYDAWFDMLDDPEQLEAFLS